MKFWKTTVLAAASLFTLGATTLLTSCEEDSCTKLICKNGGSCADGFCRCKTGYEGAECEIKTADRYIGIYYGYTICNEDPPLQDTLTISLDTEPNRLRIVRAGRPSEVIIGTATPENISVDFVDNGMGYNRKVDAVVDNKEINFITIEQLSPVNNQRRTCTFTGARF